MAWFARVTTISIVLLLCARAPAHADDPIRPVAGRALIGAAFEVGAFHGNDDRMAVGLDVWAGAGVHDRVAVLAFAQRATASLAGSFNAAGGGVRAWPLSAMPGLSVEGRVGVGWRPVTERNDPRDDENDGSDRGWMVGGAMIADFSRTSWLGVELRGSLAMVAVDGQRAAVAGLVGLGVSFY